MNGNADSMNGNTGRKHSPEARRRMSEAHMGYVPTLEQRQKLSKALKGKNTWAKGRKNTPEHAEKLRQSVLGNKFCLGKTPWNKGKKYPQISGEKHWQWKGGKTSPAQQVRTSLEYKLWRIAVFERDGYTCVWCGARNGGGEAIELNADHIKPFSQYPALRFAIDNGRTLCRPCHKKTDTFGSKALRKHG